MRLRIALLAWLLFGIAAFAQRGGGQANYPFATIRHACGPTDGPALQITLTKVENPGKDDARLFLTLYRDLPEMPLANRAPSS